MLAGTLGLAATATAAAQTDPATETTQTDTATETTVTCPSGREPLAFTDVDPNSFAYNDIRCLVELGITKPSGENYRPKDEVTREEMAAFMARTYNAVTGKQAPVVETPFTDVPETSFALNDIARVYGLGITTGATSTTYEPDKPVLRAHMALFLARFYSKIRGFEAPVATTAFEDIELRSPEQKKAIGQIFGLGVTTGTSSTTFAPTAGVTREQMGSFIARLYLALKNTAAKAPTDVTAKPTGDGTELTVSWTPVEPSGGLAVTGYLLEWKSGDQTYSVDRQQSSRTASAKITGLTRGTSYTIRVASVNSSGNGLWSAETRAVPSVAPGAVRNFKAEPGNTELILTWQPPADDGGGAITGYLVQWAADRVSDPSEFTVDNAAARTYTITGLTNTTEANPVSYYVWITAVNAAGRGTRTVAGDGGPVSPTTVAAGLPTELTVTASATSGTELVVKWKAPLDDGGAAVQGYRVQRNCTTTEGPRTGWVTIGIPGNPPGRVDVPDVPTEVNMVIVTGLDNGQPCEIRIRAVNEKTSETGPWRWAAASGTPTQAPGPPTLEATGVLVAHQSLLVTWRPPASTGGSPITGYEVTYTSGGTPRTVNTAATATTTTITGLTNGFNYTVSVKAVSASGKGPASAEVAAIPRAVPAAPRNLTARPPSAVGADGNRVVVDPESLLVTWDPPSANGTSPVTGYVVEYRESYVAQTTPDTNDEKLAGDWTNVPLTTTLVNSRSVTITALKDRRSGSATGKGVAFDVRVRATNDTSVGPNPAPGGPWAQTSATPATQPASIGADETAAAANIDVESGHQSLTVTWNPPDNGGSPITHYLLRYAEGEAGQYGTPVQIDAPDHRHTITGLDNSTSYSVVVAAVNAVGSGVYSHRINGFTAAVPPAPATVTATAPKLNSDDTPGDGTELTVTWAAVTETNGGAPITGYRVQYRRLADPDKPVPDARYSARVWKTVDGNTDPGNTDFPIGASTAQIRDLEPAASYQVRVRAVTRSDTLGTSGYAAVVKTVGIPTNVSINAVRINDAAAEEPAGTKIITWESSGRGLAEVTHYRVRWFPSVAGAPGSSGMTTIEVGSPRTHTVTDLAAGTYAAKVSACNAIGCTGEVLSSYDTRTQSGDTVTVP